MPGKPVSVSPATILSSGVAPPTPSAVRLLRRAALAVVTVTVVAAAVALLALKLAGWQALTVLTGSMRPTIAPGQVIVVSPVAIREVRPGDVITFTRPNGRGTLTHRVERIALVSDGRFQVTTRGDANQAGETWRITADGTVGRHRATLPALGGALSAVVAGSGRPYLVAGTVLVGLILVLRWIWLPERAPQRSADGSAPDPESR